MRVFKSGGTGEAFFQTDFNSDFKTSSHIVQYKHVILNNKRCFTYTGCFTMWFCNSEVIAQGLPRRPKLWKSYSGCNWEFPHLIRAHYKHLFSCTLGVKSSEVFNVMTVVVNPPLLLQTHLKRTSNASQTQLKRDWNAPQKHFKRTSNPD